MQSLHSIKLAKKKLPIILLNYSKYVAIKIFNSRSSSFIV